MQNKIELITNDLAINPKEVIAVMKGSSEFFNQKTQRVELNYMVQVLVKGQSSLITINANTEKEAEEIFNKIIKRRNEEHE